MGRTGIDLTKCNNCLFRAVYNGRPVSGTVKVGEEWCNLIFDGGIVSVRVSGLFEDSGIADFEIVPRDPETYKDWQVGDKVVNPNIKVAKDVAKEVIFRSGELVICKNPKNTIGGAYTCDELHRLGYRLVLTDIEKQIIEEKKKSEYEPRDGDVCYTENKDGYCTPFIYRHEGQNRTAFYVAFDRWGNVLTYHGYAISNENIKMLRPATEEEKQRLFDAMAKEGKRWNAEKKVVEDIPKPHEFKKGEPVLVRETSSNLWILFAYISRELNGSHCVRRGALNEEVIFRQCIPYNEKTMHLLGTTEDYKEEC